MEKRSENLLKNTLILSIGVFCTKVITFLMVPLYTRWLSQESYGNFDLIITYITLLLPILTLSSGEAIFRFLLEKKEENDKKSVVSSAFIIDIIGTIVSLIAILVVGLFTNISSLILLLFFSLLVIESFHEFTLMTCRGFKKISLYTLSGIIYICSMTILTIMNIKVFNMGLEGLLIGYIGGYFISFLFAFIKGKIYSYIDFKKINKKEIKDILKYSMPLMPNSISWWIVNVSDRTIVTMVLGASTNAILSVANKVPNLCSTFFRVFHISWQENASEAINDNDVEKYYCNIFNKMIVTMCSICMVILSLNYILFNFVFSKDYFNSFYLTPVLIFSIFVSMMAQFLGGIYVANKESKKNGFTTMLAAISNLIIHLLLINFIGIYAAVISTFCSYLILYFIRFFDIRKKYNFVTSSKSKMLILLFCLLSGLAYINNIFLYTSMFIISMIVFIFVNKGYVNKTLNIIKKKFSKRGLNV